MKRIILFLVLALTSLVSYAGYDFSKEDSIFKFSHVFGTTEWIPTTYSYVGVGVTTIAGSCAIEISYQTWSTCNDDNINKTSIVHPFNSGITATPGTDAHGEINGAQCLRVKCSSNSDGTVFIRQH